MKEALDKLKKMPLIQTRIRRLKDSNLILHQVIISSIRPIEYYEAVTDLKDDRMEVKATDVLQE